MDGKPWFILTKLKHSLGLLYKHHQERLARKQKKKTDGTCAGPVSSPPACLLQSSIGAVPQGH